MALNNLGVEVQRQYIGARYVIKIYENSQDSGSAEWEADTNYEPLTLVTYQYGSYLSKKQVPATVGNPAANGGYWVQTGFYNGQIANLQEQIDTINNTSLPAITGAIEDLEEEIGAISARRFIFCGDSYDNITSTSWIDIVSTRLGLTNTVKCAVGGYGFTPTTKKWVTLVASADIDDDSTITDICIGGGVNDSFATINNIPTDMAGFDSYVRGRFPNLKHIYIAYMGVNFADKTGYVNSMKAKNLYYDTAKTLDWEILDGVCNTLLYAPLIQAIGSDYLHPTEDGVKALGYNTSQSLKRGDCPNMHWKTITFTRDSAVGTGTFTMTQTITDGDITIHFNDTTFTSGADALSGIVTLGTCDALENSFIGKFMDVWVTRSGDQFFAVMYFNGFNELNLIVPGGHSIPAATSFSILGFDSTYKLEQAF